MAYNNVVTTLNSDTEYPHNILTLQKYTAMHHGYTYVTTSLDFILLREKKEDKISIVQWVLKESNDSLWILAEVLC